MIVGRLGLIKPLPAPIVVGGSYNGFDPAIAHAGVNLSTAIMANDTANGNATGNSRVLGLMKCPSGSKCKFEWIWNFTDGGSAFCFIGMAIHTVGDHWIGADDGAGTYHSGAGLYSDASEYAYISGSLGRLTALNNVTNGTRWAILCDCSTPAAPKLSVFDGTTTSDLLDLPPSVDLYPFFSAEATANGKGGRIITDPASFTLSNAGYGALV